MKIKLIAALMSVAVFAGMFSSTAFAASENDNSAREAQGTFVKSMLISCENYLSGGTEKSGDDPASSDSGFDDDASEPSDDRIFTELFPNGIDASLITKDFVSSLLTVKGVSEKIDAFSVKLSNAVYSIVQDEIAINSAKGIDEYLEVCIAAQKSELAQYESLYGDLVKLTAQEQMDYAKLLAENIYNKLEEMFGDTDITVPTDDDSTILTEENSGDDFDYTTPQTPEEFKAMLYNEIYQNIFVQMTTQHDNIVSDANDSIKMFEQLQGIDGFAQSAQALYIIDQQLCKLSDETAYGYIVNARDKFMNDSVENIYFSDFSGFDDLDSAPSPEDCVMNYLYNIGDDMFELSLYVDKNYFRSETQGESLKIIKENLGKISNSVKTEIDGILSVSSIDKFAGSVDEYIAAYEQAGVTPLTYGDVTADQKVTAGDVLLIRKFIAGQKITFDKFAADVNTDGIITAGDVLMIRKHIAGQNVVLGPDFPDYDDDILIGE